MCKINEIINYNGKQYKRISKKALDSMFINNMLFKLNRDEITVHALPCKANIYSPWIEFFTGKFTDIQEVEKWLNEVTYYNCNNELGKYLHYYIEVK